MPTLAQYWTLDIDSSFSERTTDDGFTVFEKPGMAIWAVVYRAMPFDSAKAVTRYLGQRPTRLEFQLPDSEHGLVGGATLTPIADGWSFVAVAAGWGQLASLEFRFQDKSQLAQAQTIWNSLRCALPDWVRKCAAATPPLAELREGLEQGYGTEAAVRKIKKRRQTQDAIAALLAAIESPTPTVRWAACEALGAIGLLQADVRSALVGRLHDDSVQVRAWAAEALVDLGEPPETVVPSMIEGLETDDGPLPKGADRIEGICEYLRIPDRYHAARILSSIGAAARPAREILLAHQMDESGGVRLRVAEALLNLGESLTDVLPPLLDGLSNPDMSERERIGFVEPLLRHGVPPEELLPSLIRAIAESGDYSTRVVALETIRMLGPRAMSAADTIERAIVDEPDKWGIKVNAAQTLCCIGAKEDVARPILVAVLDEELDSDTRAEILTDLGRTNCLDGDTCNRISRELDHPYALVRIAASFALARHGNDRGRHLDLLEAALDAKGAEVRLRSVIALGELGLAAESSTKRIQRLIRDDPNGGVGRAGIWALGRVGHRHSETKSFLVELQQTAGDQERSMIVDALGQIG